MRAQVTAVLVALQFLTTCPPILRRPFLPQEMGRAVAYFPLVGAGLGLLLAGSAALLALACPPTVVAALVLVVWIIATGSLHVDGLMDTCDGLLGGQTAEDRLRIMRDERVGGYGVVAGLLLFLVKYAALTSFDALIPALVTAPVLGRWAMTAAIVLAPYGREKGLGRDIKDHADTGQLAMATILALVAVMLVAPVQGLIAWLVAVVIAFGIVRFALQRIPGLTGDVYGAICEIVEAAVLLTFAVGVL